MNKCKKKTHNQVKWKDSKKGYTVYIERERLRKKKMVIRI